uniref:Zinc finger, CCHC-type n=1 Tax=Tanacetum cinerariifolium TaxID=118510 RepID=A0A6L2N023_TANCI|nr:zinc finger, CCHC-type [Tanacetum cinerariifolium]
MFKRVIQTVKTDMVIHTEKTGMMRLVVEIEYVGKIVDVFDKVTRSFDGLQPEQKDSILQVGNLIKEILLKLNQPDHRFILTNSKSDTERLSQSDEVLKLKNFKKDASLKLLRYQIKKVSISSIIESNDAIFDENIFSLVLRPSIRIPKRTKDIGGLVVLEKVTEEVVQQPKHELRISKRNRTPNNFRPEYQLYLIEGIKDEVSDQHFYFFNFEDDSKTFDEAMKSQDVAFWKEAINDKMDSIMGNNT